MAPPECAADAAHSFIARVALLAADRLPFTPGRCADLLESLEFGVQRVEPLIVTVPTWRPDVTLEDDLVEEVARGNGYDGSPTRGWRPAARSRPVRP